MTADTHSDCVLLYSEITDTILAELRAGRQPDVDALAARYPNLADEIGAHATQLAAVLRAGDPRESGDLPRRLGDFYLLREIGRGGMGIVYEAEQVSLRRRVALKVLPQAMLQDALRLQRFEQEAHAAAQLHHPHIVPVFAVSSENNARYYAMQFITGPSIATLVQQRRANGPSAADPARFQAAAVWGRQAAEALHYAHEVGVVHRDVKPGNLLVDDHGDLWVTDFGLARLRGEAELTATGELVGTLRYISPEQAQGVRGVADHRVDIYGLGLTLYELLTLEPAVPGEDRGELLRRLLHEEPKPPRAHDATIPHDLETIILKALRKDPAERYATAAEMADDLRRFLDRQPVLARRPTRRQRAQAWARRHAVGVAVALGVLLVVAAGLAVSTALAAHAYEEARKKQTALEVSQGLTLRANEEAKRRQEEAESKQAYAERSRAVARRAVDEVLRGVVMEWLRTDSELEPLQRQLMEQLLACCRELASEDPQDAESWLRIAQALDYSASIEMRLGRYQETLRSLERGQDALTHLDKTSEPYRSLRARFLNGLSTVHFLLGSRAEAGQELKEALALMASLRADNPDEPSYRLEEAILLSKHAFRLMAERQGWPEADALYTRSIELLSDLIYDGPAQQQHSYRYHRADTRTGWSQLLDKLGRPAEAEAAARASVEEFRAIVKERPTELPFRQGLGVSLANLAGNLTRSRRDVEALPFAEEAVRIAASLATESPNVPGHRHRQALNLGALSEALARTGKKDEAEQAAAQSAAILRSMCQELPNVALRIELGRALVRLGMYRGHLRKLAEADPAFREGIELLFEALHDTPSNHGFRNDLHTALQGVRTAQSRGQLGEAASYHEKIADHLQRLTERQPDDVFWQVKLESTHQFLGAVYLQLGRPADAERHYRLQLGILRHLADPSSKWAANAVINLAFFLSDCPLKSLREPEKALELAKQAWDAQPKKSLDHVLILASAHNGLGHHEEAAKVMAPLAEKLPANVLDFWRHWAIAQHHLGQKDRARAALKKVADWINAGNVVPPEHRLGLAEANELLGNPEPILTTPANSGG